MQVLASNSWSLQAHAVGVPKNRLLGRRELCFDGVSSASSHSHLHLNSSPNNANSAHSVPFQRFLFLFLFLFG